MSLFKTQDVKPELQSHATKQSLVTRGVASKRQIGKSLLVLAEMVEELGHNQTVQYCTGGRWSMHEMVRMILLKTGPAKVWMTTWTITEEPMRVLLDLIKTGYISELSAVLDYRIEKRKPEAFQLASNIITRIKLTKCHAKVAVIRNEEWNITIVGSANFSKNPRIEAGVIFTDKESADFHIQWIDDVIEGKEVFSAK
jgi:hypothetical protein